MNSKLVLKLLASILIVVGWIIVLAWRIAAEQPWVLLLAVAIGAAFLLWLWWPSDSGNRGAGANAK